MADWIILDCRCTVHYCPIAQLYVFFPLIDVRIFTIAGIVNFLVGIVFLPLRDALAGEVGDEVGHKGGRVFYVFAAAFFVAFMSFLRVYK